MTSTPRLIAIDMDGTLLGSNGRVSGRNLAALRACESRGIEIVIATGRRHCYAMRVLRELNLHPDRTLISSNGTVIRSLSSELLHRSHMPLETARWICSQVGDFRNTLLITFDRVNAHGEDAPDSMACESPDHLRASIGRWMDANGPYIAHIKPLEDALLNDPTDAPIQMMLCGTLDLMAAAESRLLEDPRVHASASALDEEALPCTEIVLHRTVYPERDLAILDILPAGCSKAAALLRLANLRGIDPAEILAIGDNWNDLPMLRLAGRAAVMANAPGDLLALAAKNGWQLAPSNDQDGVATILEGALN